MLRQKVVESFGVLIPKIRISVSVHVNSHLKKTTNFIPPPPPPPPAFQRCQHAKTAGNVNPSISTFGD